MLARFQETDGNTAGRRPGTDSQRPSNMLTRYPVYSLFAMQDLALKELANFLNSEVVEKVPLAKFFLPGSWVPDRVHAAKVSFSQSSLSSFYFTRW